MTRSMRTVNRMRWMAALGVATALALALGFSAQHGQLSSLTPASSPGVPASAGSSSPLDPRIAALAKSHPNQAVETIVQFKTGVSVARARRDVLRAEGNVFGELHIINALAVKLSAERAQWLAAAPDVHAVSLNAEIKPQDDGVVSGGLPISFSQSGQLQTTYDKTLGVLPGWSHGVTGAGVGVAVIDTGIAGDLPDFQSSNGQGSRVVETAVTNPYATTATDFYGHGTDVAGIIAGNGLNSSSAEYGQYIGVAPNANLVSIKVSDDSGNATVLDVIYGLQFAVDHQADYNIRVVNMSLDSTSAQSYTTDPLDAAAEAAWMQGIVVVAAAGNRGTAADAVQYAPANDPYVITVGAVDEGGQSSPLNDTVPSWSSQGTTQDGIQKPDVYAPGAHIVSVLAQNSYFASMCNQGASCTVDGNYITTGGTSMATPMISGLVADLLQLHPSWTPDQVKGALTTSWVSDNSSIQIPDASRLYRMWNPPLADQGLTPNTLITDANGDIDYTRSSWSRSSWSTASGSLSAGFARSSWSCNCSLTSAGTVDPSRSSWSTSSWSTYFGQ